MATKAVAANNKIPLLAIVKIFFYALNQIHKIYFLGFFFSGKNILRLLIYFPLERGIIGRVFQLNFWFTEILEENHRNSFPIKLFRP